MYHIWRLSERFPQWLPDPLKSFSLLTPEQMSLALSYELIREEEEIQQTWR